MPRCLVTQPTGQVRVLHANGGDLIIPRTEEGKVDGRRVPFEVIQNQEDAVAIHICIDLNV